MAKHRAIKIIKRTEAEEIERHRKLKFKCQRCNMVFLTDSELQHHRMEMHGEYQVNDTLRNSKGRVPKQDPPRKEWIVKSKKETYMWNPWKKEYFQYKLDIGCISNELYLWNKDALREMCICDEASEYFKIWRDFASSKSKIIPKEPPKPTMKFLERFTPKDVKIPKGYIVCECCNHLIRIHMPLKKTDNMLICPSCGFNALNNVMYHNYMETHRETIKKEKHIKPNVEFIPTYTKRKKRK